MAIEFAKKPEMKGDDTEAVIEDPKLPRMGEQTPRASRAKKAKVMDASPNPDKGGKDRMPAVRKGRTKAAKGRTKKSGDAFPDQVAGARAARKARSRGKAAADAFTEGSGSDSYLRMHVRVENGEMSVVNVREVEGPLAMPESLPSGFAYEVTLGPKRIAFGSVPDLGEWRSYPSPSGPPELRVHHVTRLPEAEFNVRVPREEVSLSALPKIEIALYQVKEPANDRPIMRNLPLEADFTSEIREVVRLKGIKVDALPKEAQKEIRRALK